MKNSKLINRIVGLSLLLSTCVFADNNHHATAPAFTPQKITDTIWMLQSAKGGNIAVLTGEQGLLMIDSNYKDMSAALEAELNKLGGKDKLNYIVNTHWHGDHTEGNYHYGQNAMIIAHDNVRSRLLTAQEVKLFNMKSEPYPSHALPDLTYQQTLSLYINNEEIKIIHHAGGHTDGDSIVYFKSANVLHTGDLYFAGFFPFVDVDSGGNVITVANHIDTILSTIDENTVVIPGHGPISNKAELTAYRDMLIGTSNEVKTLKNAGKTLEEVQQIGLSKKWDEWTDGFLSSEVWISIIYNSL